MLLFVTGLAMSGVGYYCGRKGTRAWAETAILICAYGAILLLAADIDRPAYGFVKSNQQPLLDVAQQIGAQTK